MKLAVPKEIAPGERRVALVPDIVRQLKRDGHEVVVESGAGESAFHADSEYRDAGADVVEGAEDTWSSADTVLKVSPPCQSESLGRHEVELLREGQAIVGFLNPLMDYELVTMLAKRGVTAFAMEMVPRITRAQSMDALSSQANGAGYIAVLLAATSMPKFMPMMTTAAGTVRPARTLVIGAGVAGLQAIATARRLGAIVEAFDTRPVVKEQVESLGAKFLEIKLGQEDAETAGGYAKELTADQQKRQQELLSKAIAQADIVVTTAAVPGRPAPKIISAETVRAMSPGACIFDLAAETGGNCELSEPGKTVEVGGVQIHAPFNLPSRLSIHTSQLYSKNVATLLADQIDDGKFKLDMEDDITKGALVTHGGEIVNAQVRAAVESTASREG